jgi:hypothetical protein
MYARIQKYVFELSRIHQMYARIDTMYARIHTMYARIDTMYARIDTMYARKGLNKLTRIIEANFLFKHIFFLW